MTNNRSTSDVAAGVVWGVIFCALAMLCGLVIPSRAQSQVRFDRIHRLEARCVIADDGSAVCPKRTFVITRKVGP